MVCYEDMVFSDGIDTSGKVIKQPFFESNIRMKYLVFLDYYILWCEGTLWDRQHNLSH